MPKEKWYVVMNAKGAGKATILIYGVIGEDWFGDGNSAKDFVTTLNELEADHDAIDIRINSPGGSVWDGLAIVNAIRNSKATIETYVDGIAYSMAAIIALAGKKTYMAKNGRLMIHNALTGVYGNAADLRREANNLDSYDDSLAITISEKTGLSVAEAKSKYMNFQDNYFNLDQAMENKLVDGPTETEAQNIAEIIQMKDYKEVLNKLKPAAFRLPASLQTEPTPPTMKKFAAVLALIGLYEEGKTAEQPAIDAAKAEFANSGLVLISAEEEQTYKAQAPQITDLKGKLEAVNKLFDGSDAEGFDLAEAITTAIEKAKKFDAGDGARTTPIIEETPPAKESLATIFGRMEHHQKATQVLG